MVDRAINMPLRVTGLDGVKRDFQSLGSSGGAAFQQIAKEAENAARNSQTALQRMRDARAQAEAIAKKNFDSLPNASAAPIQQARKTFILDQLKAAKGAIANQAKEMGDLAAQAAASGSAVEGLGVSLGGLGIAGGVAATGVTLVVGAMTAMAYSADQHESALAAFEAQLKLTGNQSGLTAAQIEALAQKTVLASGQTEKSVLAASNALAALPGVTGAAINQVLPLAAKLADVLGTDVASEAEKMGGVLSAIATRDMDALEKALAGLDPALQGTILKLADTGKAAEAQKTYLAAIADAADGPTGLSVAASNLGNRWSAMLAALGETTGIKGAVLGIIDSIGERLDWLRDRADAIGPAVRHAFAAFGWTLDTPAPTNQIVVKNVRVMLPGNTKADFDLGKDLEKAGQTRRERAKSDDLDRARTAYRASGYSDAEAERLASQFADRADKAREAAKAREPGAQRRAASEARRKAREAEAARKAGIRNESQFDQQTAQLDSQLVAAKRAALVEAQDIANAAAEQAQIEHDKTADQIDSRVKLKQYTSAQGAELKAKNDAVLKEKQAAIANDLRAAQLREAAELEISSLNTQRDVLRTEQSLATTNAQRHAIALQLLDLDFRVRAIALARAAVDPKATDKQRDAAVAELATLAQQRANEAKSLALQFASPLQQYFKDLEDQISNAGDAMERVRVDRLKRLNDDTRRFADDIANSFGSAAGALARFESPLDVVRGLLNDLSTTFTKQFVEQPVTDWVRGKSGKLAESLIGGKAGPDGLSQQQYNTALTASISELEAFNAALQQASVSLPAASAATGATPIVTVGDDLDGLGMAATDTTKALRDQTPALSQFGAGLANLLSQMGGGGSGALGSILGLVSGAIGGGAITSGVVGRLNPAAQSLIAANPGIFHGGGSVGPGGSRRQVPAAIFDNVPRLHTGTLGIASDEFPAILRRREDVLTESQSAALRSYLGGHGQQREAPRAGPTIVNINSPQPANPRRIGAVVARSAQLAAGRANYKGLAAPRVRQ